MAVSLFFPKGLREEALADFPSRPSEPECKSSSRPQIEFRWAARRREADSRLRGAHPDGLGWPRSTGGRSSVEGSYCVRAREGPPEGRPR